MSCFVDTGVAVQDAAGRADGVDQGMGRQGPPRQGEVPAERGVDRELLAALDGAD